MPLLLNDFYDRISKKQPAFTPVTITSFFPTISSTDIANKFITRYFIRQVNITDGEITEISEDSYNTLQSNVFYQTITMNWRIAGSLDDVFSNTTNQNIPTRLSTGVTTANSMSLQQANIQMPGMSSKITNLTQLYQFNTAINLNYLTGSIPPLIQTTSSIIVPGKSPLPSRDGVHIVIPPIILPNQDIIDLMSSLGSPVSGGLGRVLSIRSRRFGIAGNVSPTGTLVNTWTDARGSGYGITAFNTGALSSKPILSSSIVNFSSGTYLTTGFTSSYPSLASSSISIVMVGLFSNATTGSHLGFSFPWSLFGQGNIPAMAFFDGTATAIQITSNGFTWNVTANIGAYVQKVVSTAQAFGSARSLDGQIGVIALMKQYSPSQATSSYFLQSYPFPSSSFSFSEPSASIIGEFYGNDSTLTLPDAMPIYATMVITGTLSQHDINTIGVWASQYEQVQSNTSKFVAFAGDSITAAYKIPQSNQNYPTIVATSASFGSQWSYTTVAYPSYVIGQIDSASVSWIDPYFNASRTKNIAVLLGGTNDIAVGNSASVALQAAQAWSANRRAVGYKTVMVTMLGRGGGFSGYTTQSLEAQRLQFNAAIRAGVPQYWDAVADPGADVNFGSGSWTGSLYLSDNIHLNASGTSWLANFVAPQILSL